MSLSGIRKETGRATYDEIMRLRQRLDIIEGYRESLNQALASTGSGDGPVGSLNTVSADGRYLKLDASNDPLTGSLECIDINVQSGHVTIQAGDLTVSDGAVDVTGTKKGINVDVTTTDSAVNINVHGASADTLSPSAITNAANNLLMWFEADTLGLADGADVQTWTNSALASTDDLLQPTASVAPHYRTGETPLGKPGVIAEVVGHRMSKSELDGIDWKYGSDQGGGTDVNSAFIVVYRTDDSALANNILTMGNEDSSGQKHSFRPVGNNALGNSYIYSGNTLVQVGGSHPGNAGGTWHIAMFWYDASDDSNKCYIDGTNYDVPTTFDMQVDVDVLFRDVGSGTENVFVGTGVAAMVLVGNNSSGVQTTLDEMIKVHDFFALEYMGPSYTIGSSSAAGNALSIQNDGVTKTVFDEEGRLHIGGTDPTVELDVEGDANISGTLTVGTDVAVTGQLVSGSLSVTGLTTLSNADAAALSADSLEVSGLSTLSNTDVQALTAATLNVSGRSTLSGPTVLVDSISLKSADYIMTVTDDYILVDADAKITLPDVSVVQPYTIKNVGSGVVVTLVGPSGTIDGQTTVTIATQYDAVKVISDGTNWYIV